MAAGGELGSLAAVVAAVTACMWYARYAARRLRPGLPRLAALLPVLAALPFPPLAFRALHPRLISAFFLAWVAEFRLLLLASGQGPLHPSLPLPAFVAVATFPVTLRDPDKQSAAARRPGLGLVESAAMAALLATVVSLYRHEDRINGDHDALEKRRQDRKVAAGANDAAFANVALVAGSTGIVGAALVGMLRSHDAPAGPWKVYALCRRAPPASSSSSAASTPGAAVVVNLQVDLADAAAVAAALAPLTDVTHVFYAAWSPRRGSTDAEAHEANRVMLRNLLSAAVVPNRPGLAHVCLLTDRDHQFVDPFDPVTGTPSAMRPCHSEDLLRLDYPDLEDVLLEDLPRLFARGVARVTWSAHRLATVFGFSPRSGGRSVVAGLCVAPSSSLRHGQPPPRACS